MSDPAKSAKSRFVVATPGRSVCDDNARALFAHDMLRFIALGTRRGTKGIPRESTRLNPLVEIMSIAFAEMFSVARGESLRFRLNPYFDRWVKKQLQPGDNIISSYGYANASFEWARKHGGKTFLDGGNSHPDNFWSVLEEEHRRWNCPWPPIARHHYERAVAMLEHVDYLLSPSSFVSKSFTDRGFKPERILRNVYPVDLSNFQPATTPRPKDRPLTVICTGALSLRKGTPYLLEAFCIVSKKHPSARFRLTRYIHDSVKDIVPKYSDLPIDWSGALPHDKLAQRLRESDIFVLPSLEEGLVRTALEALACGLPAILTPNTGTADFVQPGVNGEIVPIRDPQAIADAIFKWSDRIMEQSGAAVAKFDADQVSFATFERVFMEQLHDRGFL